MCKHNAERSYRLTLVFLHRPGHRVARLERETLGSSHTQSDHAWHRTLGHAAPPAMSCEDATCLANWP